MLKFRPQRGGGYNEADIRELFLRGNDLSACATYFGITNATAERLVREAITGLAELNRVLAKRQQPETPIEIVHVTTEAS